MIVERQSVIGSSAADLFAWHARPGAFERLVPPWERVEVTRAPMGLTEGARAELTVRVGPGRVRWVAEHRSVEPGRGFTDHQIAGPFARWSHLHRFEPVGPDQCTLIDRIDCDLPLSPLGDLAEPWVRRRIRHLLRYRHDVTMGDLALHHRHRAAPRLTVAISGASGLIGRTLSAVLTSGGHRVRPMVRRSPRAGEIEWNPATRELDPQTLDQVDAVVHLAGENIAGGRWTAAQKDRIRASRIGGAETIVTALSKASPRSRTLVSASAVGIYGDRGDALLDEDSPAGSGFLAEVGQAWEETIAHAATSGVRTVSTRFGIVLTPRGGALGKMLLPFELGLGGPLGPGTQWTSWVAIDDAAAALVEVLLDPSYRGPVNVVAPNPVTNAEFARTLGATLSRPAVIPVPSCALRLVLGELADEGLLSSARAVPGRLSRAGFPFRYPTVDGALRHLLGRTVGA